MNGKKIFLLATAIAAACFVFASCGNQKNNSAKNPPEPSKDTSPANTDSIDSPDEHNGETAASSAAKASSKPLVAKLSGDAASAVGMSVKLEIRCYDDNTCEIYVNLGEAAMPMAEGTYKISADNSITCSFDGHDDITAATDANGNISCDIEWDASPHGLGNLSATLTAE